MSTNQFQRRDLPEEFDKKRKQLAKYRAGWRVCHYTLGISATIASIVAGSIGIYLPRYPIIVAGLSSFSAISIALVSFLLPSRKAKAYSEAWRILNNACNEYVFKPEIKIDTLIEAEAKAEELVRLSDPL